MQNANATRYADPLDLLRRFVPTPLKAVYRIGSVRVLVETNDFTLLPELPLNVASEDCNVPTLRWKLIRDDDTHGALEEPIRLSSGPLTVIGMGTGCLLGLDHDRRELLGFIGADIDARTHREYLVPFLCRMSTEVFCSDATPDPIPSKDQFTHG